MGRKGSLKPKEESRISHADRVRSEIAASRPPEDKTNTEAMSNLAYVVASANENIVSLQRTVKQQEREILEKSDQAAALQRNYETLARIRQADQQEFMALRAQQASERERLGQLQASLAAERSRSEHLECRLEEASKVEAEMEALREEHDRVCRDRDEMGASLQQAQRNEAELGAMNGTLKENLDKSTRAQHEMLQRSRKAEEAVRGLEADKTLSERAQAAAASKLAVQEKQLKTFLEANEALEADLRKQLQRVALLERRRAEQEAEQHTIEAYYKARIEEMQAQYDRLLSEIEDAKRVAQDSVYRTFHDNAPVLPQAAGSSPNHNPKKKVGTPTAGAAGQRQRT